jgi:LPXTG-motif cell wall-anchored protein
MKNTIILIIAGILGVVVGVWLSRRRSKRKINEAENYLDELEKEGKIKQVGKEGRFVKYELND